MGGGGGQGSQSGEPQAGGTLRWGIQADPNSLDPYRLTLEDGVREAGQDNAREFAHVNRGAALIVEGGGFRLVFFRSILTSQNATLSGSGTLSGGPVTVTPDNPRGVPCRKR